MGHFYDINGKPRHEVENKSTGGTRSSTIADAKKHKWFASVTGILDVFENPAINIWKQNQITKASYEYAQTVFGESDPWTCLGDYEYFHSHVIREAFKPSRDALDVGSQIHGALELYFQKGAYDKDQLITVDAGTFAISEFIEPTLALLAENQIVITDSELTIVNAIDGYAGKCDVAYTHKGGQGIGDFKTCGELPKKPYTFHPTQIAAYYKGRYNDFPKKKDGASGFNLYIGKNKPGDVKLFWYDWQELKAEWRVFEHALEIYRYVKGHDPRQS